MRTYLEKGTAPRFLRVQVEGAQAFDRVPRGREGELASFAERAPAALPSFCRPNVLEMIALARDEEQSFYRALSLEHRGDFVACVGFGAVAGCEDTYDFFGSVGADREWALRGAKAYLSWLRAAGARMARFELDREGELALSPLAEDGLQREGVLADFYGPGADQSLVIWRPTR